MAQFNADINLDVKAAGALAKLNKVDRAVNNVVNSANKAEAAAERLYKTLEKIENATLSKLPTQVQLLVAYLKAANKGMAQLTARASAAAFAFGNVGRVNFAPIVKATSTSITQFKALESAIVKAQVALVRFIQTSRALTDARIVPVRIGFPPGLPPGGGGGGGGGGVLPPGFSRYDGGSPNPQGRTSIAVNNIRNLEAARRALQSLYETAEIGSKSFKSLQKSISEVNQRIREAELFSDASRRRRRKGALRRLEDRRRANIRRRGNIATGFGFSALFGGGIGEILGGTLGAASGSGGDSLGRSLIGSVLGRAFDELKAQGDELAASLLNAADAAKTLVDANAASSAALKKQLQTLEELGFVATASDRAQADLARTLGADFFGNLKNSAKETEEFNTQVGILTTSLATGVANFESYIGKLLRVNEILESINVGERLERFERRAVQSGDKDLVKKLQLGFGEIEKLDVSREAKNKLISNLIDELERELPRANIEIPVKLQLQEALKQVEIKSSLVSDSLEALSIAEKYSNIDKERSKLRQESIDVLQNAEKRIADLRLSTERKVEDLRLRIIAEENRQLDRKAQIELRTLRLQQSAARSAEIAGTDPGAPGASIRENLRTAADEFNASLLAAQNERDAELRDTALELGQLEIERTRAIADVQRQVSQIQLDTQKRVATIQDKARELDSKFAKDKFNLEKKLSLLKLTEIELRAKMMEKELEVAGLINEQWIGYFQTINNLIRSARTEVNKASLGSGSAGAAAGAAGSAGVGGVNTYGLNSAMNMLIDAVEARNTLARDDYNAKINEAADAYLKQSEELTRQLPLLRERNEQLDRTREINRLISEGFSDSDAESIASGLSVFKKRAADIKAAIAELTAQRDSFLSVSKERPEILLFVEKLDGRITELKTNLVQTKTDADAFVQTFGRFEEVFKSLYQGAGQELRGLFSDLITGTDDWVASLENALNSLSNLLLNAGLTALGESAGPTSLLGKLFGGFRADGGPVSSGKSYVVGERGPELFVPGRSGTIVPNGAGGTTNVSIVVNENGSTTTATGDAEKAKQLARMVETATMQVINREKRPGGVLSR